MDGSVTNLCTKYIASLSVAYSALEAGRLINALARSRGRVARRDAKPADDISGL